MNMNEKILVYKHEADHAMFKKYFFPFSQHTGGLKRKNVLKQEDYTAFNKTTKGLFRTVRPNIVQSIRAFRAVDLAIEAGRLGQHFLYADCAGVRTRIQVFDTITTSFLLPKLTTKNYTMLYNSLTTLIHQAGTPPGFVIVLEGLPTTHRFDKEARESLLDVFRDAAEFWAERQINFRVFFSFAQVF
jgi:hypothetical protein